MLGKYKPFHVKLFQHRSNSLAWDIVEVLYPLGLTGIIHRYVENKVITGTSSPDRGWISMLPNIKSDVSTPNLFINRIFTVLVNIFIINPIIMVTYVGTFIT